MPGPPRLIERYLIPAATQLPLVPKARSGPSEYPDTIHRPRLNAFECDMICVSLRQYAAGKVAPWRRAIAEDLQWRLTDRSSGHR